MYDIERFIKAQDNCASYETALQEIQDGYKRTHWIWYVFPQIKGLGRSGYSNMYGIVSLLEAKAFIENPLLNDRLRKAVLAMTAHEGSLSAEDILGGLDAMKFRSSLTLFDIVCPEDIYSDALEAFYEGKKCQKTLDMVAEELANYTGDTALRRVKNVSGDEKAFFESGSDESMEYSVMCRTTFLLDCLRQGESMRKMVERYLWDRDLSSYRCNAVESTLKEILLYSVDNNRRLHMDTTMYNAAKEVAEEITSTDVFDMADKFDSFIADMQRNLATKLALDEFIDSY